MEETIKRFLKWNYWVQNNVDMDFYTIAELRSMVYTKYMEGVK